MKTLLKKLSSKDIRALKIGVVAVAGIGLFVIAASWIGRWEKVNKLLSLRRVELRTIVSSEVKQAGLRSIVPVFEMPQTEEKQKFLFRDKLKEQLNKSGIKCEPLEILPIRKSGSKAGYRLLCIKWTSNKCTFEQILNWLVSLNENPYLVGIEELKIKSDPKKQYEFKMDITVSTFVK